MEYRQRIADLEASEALNKKTKGNSDLFSYSKSQTEPDDCLLRGKSGDIRIFKEISAFFSFAKQNT